MSPARQKLLFVVIVVVLAVLGYYLVLPALHPTAKTVATRSPAAPAVTSVPPEPTVVAPVVTDSPASSPAGGQADGSVDIYDWLPFTEHDLAAAAAVTTRFSVDYDTYTYTESANAYLAKLNGLIVSGLSSSLEQGYLAPGVKALRIGQKQISSATATIDTLRAFGPQSLTFVATITQHLVSSKGTTNASTKYAITLTGSGTSWQVSDIEFASDGNT